VRGGDGLATLGAAAANDGAAIGRGHAGAETVLLIRAAVVGLVSTFGHEELLVFSLGPTVLQKLRIVWQRCGQGQVKSTF
jgi:hypothetical protein